MGQICLQRAFGDLVGSRIINAVSATLLGLPRNRLVIDAINANPLWTPVLGAVSAVGRVVGPVEDAALVSFSAIWTISEVFTDTSIVGVLPITRLAAIAP